MRVVLDDSKEVRRVVDADDEDLKGNTEMALSLLVMASTDIEEGSEERDEEERLTPEPDRWPRV